MFNIIVRVIIIYIIVIAMMRLMGKRQIGEMEPFELVITLIIADLATIPMAEQTIPIWYGVVPLLVISIIHFVFSLITKKSTLMRDIISGKPVIVINPEGIDFEELKSTNISCEELLEQLRNLDYFDIGDINYAILERNGKITIIPKSSSMPITREDKAIVKPETDVFYCIVENGKVIRRNFKELQHHHEPVMRDILREMSCGMPQLAFASLSASGNVYAQKKGHKVQTFKIDLPELPDEKPMNKGAATVKKSRASARFAERSDSDSGGEA